MKTWQLLELSQSALKICQRRVGWEFQRYTGFTKIWEVVGFIAIFCAECGLQCCKSAQKLGLQQVGEGSLERLRGANPTIAADEEEDDLPEHFQHRVQP